VDVRINEVNSQVQTTDSQSLLDPRVMRQIVKACMKAMKEDQVRQKRLKGDRDLTDSVQSPDD
jgi:hypothetical protein